MPELNKNFLKRKKVTLKELQSLIGCLNFACSIVVPGRAFLRRLIDLTIGIKHANHFIRITKEVKSDLCVSLQFLQCYNGKSFFFNDRWLNNNSIQIFTDASGAHGFGIVFGKKWCYGTWLEEWIGKNIAFLEFYPLLKPISW